MQRARLVSVKRICVPKQVIHDTLDALQDFGKDELEGLVLWLGDVQEEVAHVLRSLTPPQQALTDEHGVGYFVDGQTLFALNQVLAETGLRLIAQVHSHPRDAFHSPTDDRFAIVTADGGLSLVVPDFGDASPDPASWAVYRLLNGRWAGLTESEAKRLFQIGETSASSSDPST